jgi:hypothetical protein
VASRKHDDETGSADAQSPVPLLDEATIARDALHRPQPTEQLIAALIEHADNLQVQGNLFNVPLVAALAASLHKLMIHVPQSAELPMALVDAHIDALRALGPAGSKRETKPESAELVRRLRQEVHRAVAAWDERASRPDVG